MGEGRRVLEELQFRAHANFCTCNGGGISILSQLACFTSARELAAEKNPSIPLPLNSSSKFNVRVDVVETEFIWSLARGDKAECCYCFCCFF